MDQLTIALTDITSLLQALVGFAIAVSSVMGVAAEIASRLPKPNRSSSDNYKKVYRVANWLGRNVKHAENKDV